MKFLKSLFILLICMVSFTALATTPTMEEKQKATYEMVQSLDYVVNVELQITAVSYENVEMQKAECILNSTKSVTLETPLAIITDVGWQSLKAINIKNKTNLVAVKNYDNRIRSDTK